MITEWERLTQENKNKLKAEMAKLYEEASEKLSQLPSPCTACGHCCHFALNDYHLYASTLELAYLLDKYQATPLKDKGVCPFLLDNKCSVRDRRMLGCRTYFRLHDKEQQIKGEAIYEQMHTSLKQLHQKYGIAWNYQDCMEIFAQQFGIE